MKKLIYLSIVVLFSMYNANLNAQDPGDSTDVYGCMDATALNYNQFATIDNGSCIYYCDSTSAFFWIYAMNDSLTLIQNYSYSIAGITSYSWDFGDGNTSSLENPTNTYAVAGIYTVCLTITAPSEDLLTVCSSIYCDSLYVSDGATISVIDVVYGCTDPSALNYNPLATFNDGSCNYNNDTIVIYGCTDPSALNFNQLATVDDGSCIYDNDSTGTGFIYGCMDPAALNYNPLATIDDGSCYYDNDTSGTNFIYGCMDPNALNYNFLATVDDGSCIYDNDSTGTGGDSLLCNAYFIIDEINEDEGYVTVINLSTGVDMNYYWDFGDSTFSTEAYPTHIYENEGFYMVCLTVVGNNPVGGDCASTYCDTVGIYFFQKTNGFTLNIIPNEATGIDEPLDEISDINLYPNPANERLTLSMISAQNELITMSIYDLSGRVVKTWNSTITYGNNKMNIDIYDLSPGLYHLELRNNDERKVKRFQIIK